MIHRRNVVYGLIILALIGGMFQSFLLNIAYVLGLALVASLIFSWMSVNWLQIKRWTYIRRMQVGDYFDETFVVLNASIIPKLWLEIRDHSTLPQHKGSRVVPVLKGRGSHQWWIQTACTRRGPRA